MLSINQRNKISTEIVNIFLNGLKPILEIFNEYGLEFKNENIFDEIRNTHIKLLNYSTDSHQDIQNLLCAKKSLISASIIGHEELTDQIYKNNRSSLNIELRELYKETIKANNDKAHFLNDHQYFRHINEKRQSIIKTVDTIEASSSIRYDRLREILSQNININTINIQFHTHEWKNFIYKFNNILNLENELRTLVPTKLTTSNIHHTNILYALLIGKKHKIEANNDLDIGYIDGIEYFIIDLENEIIIQYLNKISEYLIVDKEIKTKIGNFNERLNALVSLQDYKDFELEILHHTNLKEIEPIQDNKKPIEEEPVHLEKGSLSFKCNICGEFSMIHMLNFSREEVSCYKCGSTVRMRSMIHVLSSELFGESLTLIDFPVRKDIKGIGMSDWRRYADILSEKFDYTNTYYHKEPKLDIMNIPEELIGTLDFILSTDVYEHVLSPVSKAFDNTKKLLKKTGIFVFSVPYKLSGETKEHFKDLCNFSVLENSGEYTLENIDSLGNKKTYKDLVFHGGPGETLEMRVFTKDSIERHFVDSGFLEYEFYEDNFFDYGIYYPITLSIPIAGRNSEKIQQKEIPTHKEAIILDWGPKEAKTNESFNLQKNGLSTFWFKGTNMSYIREISIGNAQYTLKNIVVDETNTTISGQIDHNDFLQHGTHEIFGYSENNIRVKIGIFRLTQSPENCVK